LVPGSTAPLLIGILISCSLPQLIGAIICFRRGEVLFASIAGLFGTVITLGAAFTLFQLAIQGGGHFTPEVMGAFWLALFVITEVFAIGFGHAPYTWFIMAGIAEVGVAFFFLGLVNLGAAQITGAIAGWLLIIFSAFCIYSAAAIVLGEHFQRPMLPLGRPVIK